MANVFISHRSSDTPEAERLAIEIRTAGHKVWLDAWEIGVGDQIVDEMNKGLAGGAPYLVVCYSSSGVDAAWMTIEWVSALARQLNGQGVKVLPVRLTGSKGPAILDGTKYADLLMDWDSGVDALLLAIK